MKNSIKMLSLLIIVGLVFSACSDDDNPSNNTNPGNLIQPEEQMNLHTYNADTPDDITYYSLREGKVIDRADSLTDKWDIAFRRTDIYVNQGFRGPGNGGAFVMRTTDFETLAQLPADSTFYDEVSATERAIPTGSGKGWYNYDHQTFEVSPIPGVVLAIRTADGRYAKVKILSYYEGYPDNIPEDPYQRIERCYSFKYVFQPDGTKNFRK